MPTTPTDPPRGPSADGGVGRESSVSRSAGIGGRPSSTGSADPQGAQDPQLRGYADAQDIQLLERIAAGDQEAFRDFYNRWAERLNTAILGWSRREVPGEELLQEVFLAIWRRASSYDPSRGDVGGWLFVLCRNQWHDFLRRQPSEANGEINPRPFRAAGSDARNDLLRAIATLQEPEREAAQLILFGGSTPEEAAEHLDLPLGTLKTLLRHGLRRIARISRLPEQDP